MLAERDLPCPLVVDKMADGANLAYGAWPERAFILQEDRVALANPGGSRGYNLEEVRVWLESYAKARSQGAV